MNATEIEKNATKMRECKGTEAVKIIWGNKKEGKLSNNHISSAPDPLYNIILLGYLISFIWIYKYMYLNHRNTSI